MTLTRPVDLLRAVIKRREPPEWLDWLPLTELAWDHPAALTKAFNELRLEQQFDLLALVREASEGPLAEAVLLKLGERAAEIEDLAVRNEVLFDAGDGLVRSRERLEALRSRLVAAGQSAQTPERRLGEEFDLGVDLLRLEAQCTALRQRENDLDERFSGLHVLEREIRVLEARLRYVQAYDEPSRRAEQQRLRVAVEAFEARKKEQEDAVEAEEEELARRRGEALALAESQRSLEAEARSLAEQHAETVIGLETLKLQVGRLRSEKENLRASFDQVQRQVDAEEEESRHLAADVQTAHTELAALREAASRSRWTELAARIQEVFQMLPPDEPDQAFQLSRMATALPQGRDSET